jgi:hypothetical protein
MKNKLTLLLFFFVSNFIFAQSYIQVPLDASANNVKIINLKEKGILICQKTENDQIKFRKYDTNLLYEWEIRSPFNSKYIYLDDYYDGNFVYIAFESDKEKTLEIFKIAANIAVVNQVSINILPGFKLTHFKANEQVICLAGIINKEPLMVVSNSNSKIPKYISINGKNSNGIQSLDINTENEIILTMIRTDLSRSEIIYRNYTSEGKIKETLFIQANEQQEYLSSRYFQLGKKHLVIGNYGSMAFYKEELQNTQGMFITELDKELKTTFYNLNTFKNAFNFLSEKEKEKMSKQIEKRKSKGKEFKYTYRLAINELSKLDDKLLISAEMFQPIFRNSSNSNFPINTYSTYNPLAFGRSFFYNPYYYNNSINTRSTKYFDGYRYFSGMVMAIDSTAKLVWDNSVAFKNIFSMDLKSHMKINLLANKHMLSYGDGQKFLLSNYSNKGDYINTVDYSTSSADFFNKTKKKDYENFEHWHEDFFLSWGFLNKIDKNANTSLYCLIQKITLE